MTVFCSWSGGKESTLALDRAIKNGLEINYLINMVPEEGSKVGHGLPRGFYSTQAKSLGIELEQAETSWKKYEQKFSGLVKKIPAGKGVFGDVYLEDHKEWVESKGEELGFEAIEPLWGDKPERLYHEYLDKGFQAIIVKVNPEKVPLEWLGRTLDEDFLDFLKKTNNCLLGEKGEYHTATIDGPLFENRIEIEIGGKMEYGNGKIIELEKYRLV